MVYCAWCMVYCVLCIVYGVLFLVYGVWFIVHGVWCIVHCVWCMVYCAWCMVYGLLCMVHGVWCMVYGACMVHGALLYEHQRGDVLLYSVITNCTEQTPLAKLIVTQMVTNFPLFYGTRWLILVLTNRHLLLQ